MSKGFNGAVLKLLGAKEHLLTVTATEQPRNHFVRVYFHSDTLLADDGEQPGNWVRAWFPDPDGGTKEFQRGYTLLQADPAAGTFAVDFVIHEPTGPASAWACTCQPGDAISGMRYGERHFELLDPPPAGYLLLGDLSSYPAITSIVETIPQDIPVVIYMESHGEEQQTVPLPEGPHITTHWVAARPDGEALSNAIDGQDWSGWFAWVTAETVSTRKTKTALRKRHGLSKESFYALAYWVRGRAMGTSRGDAQ